MFWRRVYFEMMNHQPLSRYRRPGLIEPSDEEFAALMALWEEGRREQQKLSLQMRLDIALQILKPLPL
jgi:hypothetical protein